MRQPVKVMLTVMAATSAVAACAVSTVGAGDGPGRSAVAASCPSEAEAGMLALDAFMTGWNSKNEATWEASLHFPHVRLAGGRTTVLPAPGGQRGVFERMSAQGWDHSAWLSRELVQCGPNKAHFATVFARYRADGGEISRFASLYIVEKRNGKWAVSARSSFAE
ncbi:hypothetical protein GC169_07150 [bacterium]|nr:hypothetical protein [bacterium]